MKKILIIISIFSLSIISAQIKNNEEVLVEQIMNKYDYIATNYDQDLKGSVYSRDHKKIYIEGNDLYFIYKVYYKGNYDVTNKTKIDLTKISVFQLQKMNKNFAFNYQFQCKKEVECIENTIINIDESTTVENKEKFESRFILTSKADELGIRFAKAFKGLLSSKGNTDCDFILNNK